MNETGQKKTALVFGATGLVGQFLLKRLCEHEAYNIVVVFTRRTTGYDHPKLKEVIDPLNDLEDIREHISGNDMYCCIGTTIKTAGTKENFRRIDLDMPLRLAKICEKNKISTFVAISSIGANPESTNFYLRTKGEMETAVLDCSIPKIAVVRPSMLLGPRNEFRFGEKIGKMIMVVLNPFFRGRFRKYKAIHADVVARAMILIALSEDCEKEIYESDELEEIATENCSG